MPRSYFDWMCRMGFHRFAKLEDGCFCVWCLAQRGEPNP